MMVGAIFFFQKKKSEREKGEGKGRKTEMTWIHFRACNYTTIPRKIENTSKYIDFGGNSDQPKGSPNLCDCLSVIEAQTLIFE
jgi:hypothetical protein